MTTVYIVGLLLITVVAANIVHLLWPILPLAIYQILAGIMLSILPIDTHAIVLKPELFMLLIIAPLMFNDGQNVSFRQLAQNVRQILSMAVGLAIILGERTPELVRVMNRPDKAPKRCFLFGFRFLWLYNLAAN